MQRGPFDPPPPYDQSAAAPPPYSQAVPGAKPPRPEQQPAPRYDLGTPGLTSSHPPVVVVESASHGNCPHCGIGNVVEEFSLLGVLLAILFFPWGIICCLLLIERRCTYCGRSPDRFMF